MKKHKGVADVFRGAESLGTVMYRFTEHDDGGVEGFLVERGHLDLHPSAGRVPQTFLPLRAGVDRDLHLTLSDGRRVVFMVPSTDGSILNGRIEE